MNSLLSLAAATLLTAATLSATQAHATDGEIAAPTPTTGQTPLSEPDLAKARLNLERIQARVHELNPQLVNSVSSKLNTSDWYVKNTIALNLMVRGKIYNELGVDLAVAETSLGIDRVTSADIQGEVKVSGYELVKKTLSTRDGKPSDEAKAENLANGQKACARIQTLSKEELIKDTTRAEDYAECALEYHLLNSQNFSEFLVDVKPLAAQFKKIANEASYEVLKSQAGPWGAFFIYHLFTGNKFDVCTASIWDPLCLGREYIDIGLNFGTLGLTHANAGLYITKDKLRFSISAYSFQRLASLLAGNQQASNGLYIPISDVQNYVIGKLATMNDQDIENTAKEISGSIDTVAQELDMLGIK